jgi:hypothetical protein
VAGPAFAGAWLVDESGEAEVAEVSAAATAHPKPAAAAVPIPKATASMPTRPTFAAARILGLCPTARVV